MTTLTIGILPYDEMKARTLAIARGQLHAFLQACLQMLERLLARVEQAVLQRAQATGLLLQAQGGG